MNITHDYELMIKPDQEYLDKVRQNVTDTIERARIAYDKEGMRVLEIGLLKGGAKDTFKHATVETLDIIEGGDYKMDICEYCYSKGTELLKATFDCIICTEVLEHTTNPFSAVHSIRLMLKKGGSAYVTTPFNFRIHNPLPDNWRFTEHGLRQLFKDFDNVEVKGVETEGRILMPLCYSLVAVRPD